MLAAQYWGKQDTLTIERIMGIGMRISILISTVFFILACFFPSLLMLIFTNDKELIATGIPYLRIVSFSYLFMSISQVYLCTMRTIERVIFATAANASALLLNIFLNAVFIFGLLGAPKMGIAGVALATTIARGIEFGICMLDALHFKVIRFRPAAIFERNKVLFADFMKYSLPADMVDDETKFFINPTGRFVIGGPHGDSGLTGRKIIVDTYGGYARHGGGAFSGKDCTKVDRSAAYAARYVAKNIVAAGLAKKCEIQLSYAIGVAHPTSIMVDTFGTGKISAESLVEMIRKEFDLRPAGIIQMLDLRRPIYKQTAAYGHFGRNDLNLPWERLDKVEELKKYLK